MKHFELVNRELIARKILSELKQTGKLHSVREYNKEFSRWLLQIPSMENDEQIFHYSHGLKHKIRIEVERVEPESLDHAMRIAEKFDGLYSSNGSNFGYTSNYPGYSSGPTPMQIGNLQNRRIYNQGFHQRLSPAEKRRMANKLCYVCGKPNCIARNHSGGRLRNHSQFGVQRAQSSQRGSQFSSNSEKN